MQHILTIEKRAKADQPHLRLTINRVFSTDSSFKRQLSETLVILSVSV